MTVKKGDKVKVDYTGTLEDGSVFDTSEGKEPLAFEVGSGQLIKGFDEGVIGMKEGEEKTITLKPEEAYGQPNPEMIQKVPRDKFPTDQEVKEGMMVGVGLPTGQQMPAKITSVNDKEITLDLNHPLAGKVLNFKIKVVSIEA